jgi:hypothetical protein
VVRERRLTHSVIAALVAAIHAHLRKFTGALLEKYNDFRWFCSTPMTNFLFLRLVRG